jgi:hypothetical protein
VIAGVSSKYLIIYCPVDHGDTYALNPPPCLLVCALVMLPELPAVPRHSATHCNAIYVCYYLRRSFVSALRRSRRFPTALSSCLEERIDDLVFQTFTVTSFLCIPLYMYVYVEIKKYVFISGWNSIRLWSPLYREYFYSHPIKYMEAIRHTFKIFVKVCMIFHSQD